MIGEPVFTHQIPRAIHECRPHLLAQHPQLAAVEVPDEFADAEEVHAWLSQQEAIYGAMLDIEPLAAEDHTFIDPIVELKMIRPDMPIIIVETD